MAVWLLHGCVPAAPVLAPAYAPRPRPQRKAKVMADLAHIPRTPTKYSKTKKSSSFSRMTSFNLIMHGWFSLRSDLTSRRFMHSSHE